MAKAYALFDSVASKEELAKELPTNILNLEFLLTETREAKNLDQDLLNILNEQKIYQIIPSRLKHLMATDESIPIKYLKYILEANNPSATVETVVDCLTETANIIYQKYDLDRPFNIAIIGQELDGSYSIFEE